jgi:hypothetical protein
MCVVFDHWRNANMSEPLAIGLGSYYVNAGTVRTLVKQRALLTDALRQLLAEADDVAKRVAWNDGNIGRDAARAALTSAASSFKITVIYAPGDSMVGYQIDALSLASATHWARMAYREAASITVEAATL